MSTAMNKIGAELSPANGMALQKADEAKFDQKVENMKAKVDSFGKQIVNVLERETSVAGQVKGGVEVLRAPVKAITNLTLTQPEINEDGEEVELPLKSKLGNFHKNVVIKGEEYSREAGSRAHLATRKFLTPIRNGAKLINRENIGATIQNSVALAIGFLVRGILFILSQLGHLRTPAAAVGIGVAAAATIVLPQGLAIVGLVQNKKLSAQVSDLTKEVKSLKKAAAPVTPVASSNKKIALGVSVGAVIAATIALVLLKPEVATQVAGYAMSAGQAVLGKVTSIFARIPVPTNICTLADKVIANTGVCSVNATEYAVNL